VFLSEFTTLELSAVHRLKHPKLGDDLDMGHNCLSKLICVKSQDERVVGFHFVGPNAGEITQVRLSWRRGFSSINALSRSAAPPWADWVGTTGPTQSIAGRARMGKGARRCPARALALTSFLSPPGLRTGGQAGRQEGRLR
jgi:hypothetical protein